MLESFDHGGGVLDQTAPSVWKEPVSTIANCFSGPKAVPAAASPMQMSPLLCALW